MPVVHDPCGAANAVRAGVTPRAAIATLEETRRRLKFFIGCPLWFWSGCPTAAACSCREDESKRDGQDDRRDDDPTVHVGFLAVLTDTQSDTDDGVTAGLGATGEDQTVVSSRQGSGDDETSLQDPQRIDGSNPQFDRGRTHPHLDGDIWFVPSGFDGQGVTRLQREIAVSVKRDPPAISRHAVDRCGDLTCGDHK